MSYVAHDESVFVRPAEVEEPELYHPRTFIGKYIWSQDAKVIGVQYAITAIAVPTARTTALPTSFHDRRGAATGTAPPVPASKIRC